MTGILSQPYIPGLSDFRVAEADAQRRGTQGMNQRIGILRMQEMERQAREAEQTGPLNRQLLEAQVRNAQNPAPTRVDLGDRIGLVDGTGQLIGFIPKGATPDTVLREQGAATRHQVPSGSAALGANVTMRGQDMTDARTRSEGAANRAVTTAGQNRPQFNESAGGWVIPPAVGPIPQAPTQPQGGMQIPPQVQAQRDAEAARIRAGEASGGAGMIPTSSVIPVPGLTPGQGRPPQGYRFNQSGNLEAIPGGPADIKTGETAERNRRREDAAMSRADLVIGKVDKALEQTGFFTTGMLGAASGHVPNTPAYNYQKTLDTIIGNIGFQELQAMREASPTGGALGQVAVRELEMLQSVLSSLDRGQGEAQQRENLRAVGNHFTNWKNAVRQSRGLPPLPNKFEQQPMRRKEDIFKAADAIIGGQ